MARLHLCLAACLHPSPSFYSEFNGYTLGLLFCLMSIGVLWLLGAKVVARVTLCGLDEAERADRLARFDSTMLSRALIVLFLVYPGVSVAIFQVFTCTQLESGTSILDADARITCWDSTHRRYVGGAIVWLFLVPVGVPAFFTVLLHRFRVPQMARLLEQNAWLRAAMAHAWKEGLPQPPGAASLAVDTIETIHLEALYAFFLRGSTVEEAAAILAGTAPRLPEEPEEEPQRATGVVGRLVGRLVAALRAAAARLWLIVSRNAAAAGAKHDPDDEVARRQFLLDVLLTWCRSSGDVAIPTIVWEKLDDEEQEHHEQEGPPAEHQATDVNSSALRTKDVPRLLEHALKECGFLFADYRVRCWYWESVELVRKLMLTSILALIAPGSAGQVVVGLLLAFVMLIANLKTQPYAAEALNNVNQAAQLNLFLVLLVALLLKVNLDGEGDNHFFTGIVGALCIAPVCLPVLVRLYVRARSGGVEARTLMRDNQWN